MTHIPCGFPRSMFWVMCSSGIVANALFHVYVCVGDYTLLSITPYLYGVTSVTWVTMGIRGITCGLRANQATSRVPVGLSD